jgi:pyrroline-5-carboxylate reductase
LFGAHPPVADKEMNLYTALTAVGPTYVLPVFDAMIRAGIDGGLTRQAATAAAAETARGCADMTARREDTPEQLNPSSTPGFERSTMRRCRVGHQGYLGRILSLESVQRR